MPVRSNDLNSHTVFFRQLLKKNGPWLPRGGREISPETSDAGGIFEGELGGPSPGSKIRPDTDEEIPLGDMLAGNAVATRRTRPAMAVEETRQNQRALRGSLQR